MLPLGPRDWALGEGDLPQQAARPVQEGAGVVGRGPRSRPGGSGVDDTGPPVVAARPPLAESQNYLSLTSGLWNEAGASPVAAGASPGVSRAAARGQGEGARPVLKPSL